MDTITYPKSITEKLITCKPSLVYLIVALLLASVVFITTLNMKNFISQICSILSVTSVLIALCYIFPKNGAKIGWVIILIILGIMMCSISSLVVGVTKQMISNNY